MEYRISLSESDSYSEESLEKINVNDNKEKNLSNKKEEEPNNDESEEDTKFYPKKKRKKNK